MNHFTKVCKHGQVVLQCRCPGPKATIIVPCPDPVAHAGMNEIKVEKSSPVLPGEDFN